MEIYKTITSIDFWLEVIENIKDFGPFAPILLTLIEAFIPALPLIAIVSFNVNVYGTTMGFIYSWLGSYGGSVLVFLVFRHVIKKYLIKYINNREQLKKLANYISNKGYHILFLLTALPFTPSSLINITYGLSDIDEAFFIKTLLLSKSVMIAYMSFFGYSLSQILEKPIWLIGSSVSLIALYYISKEISKRYLSTK